MKIIAVELQPKSIIYAILQVWLKQLQHHSKIGNVRKQLYDLQSGEAESRKWARQYSDGDHHLG